MKRILVVGCAGAGKSTFARRLSEKTGMPLIHLDQHYWQPRWIEPELAGWISRVEALSAEPCWIMDGNYGDTLSLRLDRADTVVFLDMPRWLCLWRVLKRTTRYFGRSREDMTKNCPERFDWIFTKYIWNYQRNHRQKLLDELQKHQQTTVVLGNPADVDRYLSNLPHQDLLKRNGG